MERDQFLDTADSDCDEFEVLRLASQKEGAQCFVTFREF